MVSPFKGKLNLDKPIKQSLSWLDVGDYEHVTIADIDPLDTPTTGRLKVAFEKNKRYHREQIFLLNKAKEHISHKLSLLIAAALPGPEITDYYQWLMDDDWQDALQALRGMVVNISISLSDGYGVEYDPDRQVYIAKIKDEVVCEAEQLELLDRVCRARGLSKAFRSVNFISEGEGHVVKRNLVAIRAALKSREDGASRKADSSATKTARFIRATSGK